MAYDKVANYFCWKADCLISSYQRRAKKHKVKYTYLTARKEYAKIVEEKLKLPCEYCGCKLTRKNLNVDHKMPVSRGGSFDGDNLAYVCDKCNKAKAELSYDEFKALLTLIKTWNDGGKYILKQLRAASLAFRKRF